MRARYNRGFYNVNSDSMELTTNDEELFLTVRNAVGTLQRAVDETRFRGGRYDCIEIRYVWITLSLFAFSDSILECDGDLENDRFEKSNSELNSLTL
jgi:hypothetical protein